LKIRKNFGFRQGAVRSSYLAESVQEQQRRLKPKGVAKGKKIFLRSVLTKTKQRFIRLERIHTCGQGNPKSAKAAIQKTMKAIIPSILFIFFTFFSISSTAQTWDWAVKAGGVMSDRSTDVRCDSVGDIYTVGYFNGGGDFDGIPVSGYYATDKTTFIAKYDSLGNCIWVRQSTIDMGTFSNYYDDRALGVAVDSDGDIYITGVFWDDIQFGPFYLSDGFGVSCCDQVYVAKLDSDGNWLWAHWIGSYADDQGQDIQVDTKWNLPKNSLYTISLTSISGNFTSDVP